MSHRYPVGDFPFDDRELERLLREQEDERARARSLNVPPVGFNAQPGIVPLSMWREVQQQEFLTSAGQTILEEEGRDLAFNDLVDEIPRATGREKIQTQWNFDNRQREEARERMTRAFSRPIDPTAPGRRPRPEFDLQGDPSAVGGGIVAFERLDPNNEFTTFDFENIRRVRLEITSKNNLRNLTQNDIPIVEWLMKQDPEIAAKYESGFRRLSLDRLRLPSTSFGGRLGVLAATPLRGLGEFGEFLENNIDRPFRNNVLQPIMQWGLDLEEATGWDWLVGDIGEAIAKGEDPTGITGEIYKMFATPSIVLGGPAGRGGIAVTNFVRTTRAINTPFVRPTIRALEVVSRADVAIETAAIAALKVPFRATAQGLRTGNQAVTAASEVMLAQFRRLNLPESMAHYAASRPPSLVPDEQFFALVERFQAALGRRTALTTPPAAQPEVAGGAFGPTTARVAETQIQGFNPSTIGAEQLGKQSDVPDEVLAFIDRAERTQPIVTGFVEKMGHAPIIGDLINRGGSLWTDAAKTPTPLHIFHRAYSDYVHREAVGLEARLGPFLQAFRREFGKLDRPTSKLTINPDAILTPVENRIYGTVMDAVERPNFYALTDSQLDLINDFQRYLDTDIESTLAMGGSWGRVYNNYVTHTDVRDLGTRWSWNPKIKGTTPEPREFPTMGRRLLDQGVPEAPKLGNGYEPYLDFEATMRARLLASARERGNRIIINGVRSLGEPDIVHKGGFRSIDVIPELGGLQFDNALAAHVERLFTPDKLRGNPLVTGLEAARQIMLSVDTSFITIQGQLAFLMTSPVQFAKTVPTAAKALMSTDFYVDFMARNEELLLQAAEDGKRFAIPGAKGEFNADIWETIARRQQEVLERFVGEKAATILTRTTPLALPNMVSAINEAGFQRLMTVLGLSKYKNNLDFLGLMADDLATRQAAGIPFPSNLGDLAFLAEAAVRRGKVDRRVLGAAAARDANATIPMVNMSDFALSETRRTFERLALISPSFFRAPLQMVQSALTDAGPRGMLARRSTVNMVATGSLLVAGMNEAFGCANVEDSLNPAHRDFWRVCTPWGNFSIGGAYRSLAATILRSDGDPVLAMKEWAEGRAGVLPRGALDIATNQDFYGNAITDVAGGSIGSIPDIAAHLAGGIAPLPFQEAARGFSEGLPPDEFAFLVGGQLAGLNVNPPSPFDERDRLVRAALLRGVIDFEHIDADSINSYFDLPLAEQIAFDARHPKLTERIAERGKSAFAEYAREADKNIESAATNVRADFERFREGAIDGEALREGIDDALTQIFLENRQAAESAGLDTPSDLESEDLNKRAVAEFYNVFTGTCVITVQATDTVSDRVDNDCVARELALLEKTWTPEQREWVDLDTGSARKKLFLQVPAAGVVLDLRSELSQSGYWDIEHEVWTVEWANTPITERFATYDAYQAHLRSVLASNPLITDRLEEFTSLEQISGPLKDAVERHLRENDETFAGVDRMKQMRSGLRDQLIFTSPRLGAILVTLGYREFSGFKADLRGFVEVEIEKLRADLETLPIVPTDPSDETPTTTQIGRPVSAESVRALDLWRTTNMTQAEIGTELNISTKAVESIVFRARRDGEPVARPSIT